MKTRKIAGQKSWTMAGSHVDAALTCRGGHLGPIRFRLGRRWIAPYDLAPWAEEKLAPGTPQVLRSLRGDFFCMPFGGSETSYRGEKHLPHGETANARWKFEWNNATRYHFSLKTSVRKGRVDKIIEFVPGHTAIYSRHIISGMNGPMPLGHHAVLHPGAGRRGRISTSPFKFGQVLTTRFEDPAKGTYSILKIGAKFKRLDRVPRSDGGFADLSRYPAREGYDDLVLMASDASLPWTWTALVVPEQKYVWFALKDPRVLHSSVFWMSNGGRHYPPWNGRHRHAIGLEEVTSHFAYGIAESAKPNALSRAGIPTVLRLSAKKPLVVNYIMAVAEIPSGFDIVKSIVASRDGKGVVLTSRSGKKVSTPLNVPFLFLTK
jgi:hypothetical protein